MDPTYRATYAPSSDTAADDRDVLVTFSRCDATLPSIRAMCATTKAGAALFSASDTEQRIGWILASDPQGPAIWLRADGSLATGMEPPPDTIAGGAAPVA